MTDTTESLRHKLRSGKELKAVVHTMKTLAASCIGQYESALRSLVDYQRTLEFGISVCLREEHRERGEGSRRVVPTDASGPPPTSIVAIVFGSDLGLVGRFNEVLAEFAVRAMSTYSVRRCCCAIGERVADHLTDARLPPKRVLLVPSSVQSISSFVGEILLELEPVVASELLSETVLFYHHPLAGAGYEPHALRLLPLDDVWLNSLPQLPWPRQVIPEVLGEPSRTLEAFVREYLFVALYRAFVESLASENACRLAAMQRAEKNIDELLEELNSTYHRLRQSGIDAELFDLVAGFEALTQRY